MMVGVLPPRTMPARQEYLVYYVYFGEKNPVILLCWWVLVVCLPEPCQQDRGLPGGQTAWRPCCTERSECSVCQPPQWPSSEWWWYWFYSEDSFSAVSILDHNLLYNDHYITFFFLSPAVYLGFTIFGWYFLRIWPFFNPTIKVVTFRLRGWCMLGVFLLLTFTRLGHECQDLLSLCGLYSHPKELLGEWSLNPC